MQPQRPDRRIPPPLREIGQLQLPEPQRHRLDNGLEVIEVRMGSQDILKLELSFRSGRPFEHERLAGRATAGMLKEGTQNWSASRIAETIDFYGGTLSIPVNLDFSVITLYSLRRHFEALLPMVSELVTQPRFPEKELNAYADRSIRRLEVDLQRNDILAYRAITEQIFGSDHPYGYNSVPDDYRNLHSGLLREHFRQTYTAANCTLFISGRTDERTISLLNTYLGQSLPPGQRLDHPVPPVTIERTRARIDQPDQVQSAIRIGRRLFSRHHSDYPGMYVLNTILGGYFGSRLMENIREDKGYTYNIYSLIDPMLYDGYFTIGTEVGTEFTAAALQEIYREIARLREELIGEEELTMVRNYLLGNMLTMLDGPFHVAEVIRTQETDGLAPDFFARLCDTIRRITAEELRELARKYLQESDLSEVVAG